ncbi:MAG TPA: hypothetical protein VF195_02950 [Actinomycetota bacterium]
MAGREGLARGVDGPILFLHVRAMRRGTVGTVATDAMDQEIDLAD